MVDMPRAVVQMPTACQVTRKKCRLRLLLKEAYGKQATEVTVGSHDVVSLVLLAELVAVVLGLELSDFTNQQEGHQGTVNGVKRMPTKTPATPNKWNGCTRIVCSASNTNM